MRALLLGLALVLILGAAKRGMAAVAQSERDRAEEGLAARSASRGLSYPPQGLALIALKSEVRVELWARATFSWSLS